MGQAEVQSPDPALLLQEEDGEETETQKAACLETLCGPVSGSLSAESRVCSYLQFHCSYPVEAKLERLYRRLPVAARTPMPSPAVVVQS